MKAAKLLSLSEAADLLHLEGSNRVQRARRTLLKLQQETGAAFLIQSGGVGVGTRYKVSVSLLRKAAPYLFEVEERPAPGPEDEPCPVSVADVQASAHELLERHQATVERLEDALLTLADDVRHIARRLDERLNALEAGKGGRR
jgi:hypothetical protein